MSDDEQEYSLGISTEESGSFEDLGDGKVDDVQALRSRIKFLEEANLALRQELHRVKRSPSRGVEDHTTKAPDNDQTASKSIDHNSTSMQHSDSRIAQSQDEAFKKLSCGSDYTALDYKPSSSMSYTMSQHQQKTISKVDTIDSTVQELETAKRDMEERLRKLEINEQYGVLQNRVSVCERKMNSIISRKEAFEAKIQETVSDWTAQNKSNERTFQAYILNKLPIKKANVPVRLDQFKEYFLSSPHFSRETCEYTVPATGLYVFHARWRQSGRGQFRVTIHWGEEKVSRLGQTSSDNDVLCPSIRRYVEQDVKVWLTVTLMSGAPTLESCDFGGSFVCIR